MFAVPRRADDSQERRRPRAGTFDRARPRSQRQGHAVGDDRHPVLEPLDHGAHAPVAVDVVLGCHLEHVDEIEMIGERVEDLGAKSDSYPGTPVIRETSIEDLRFHARPGPCRQRLRDDGRISCRPPPSQNRSSSPVANRARRLRSPDRTRKRRAIRRTRAARASRIAAGNGDGRRSRTRRSILGPGGRSRSLATSRRSTLDVLPRRARGLGHAD